MQKYRRTRKEKYMEHELKKEGEKTVRIVSLRSTFSAEQLGRPASAKDFNCPRDCNSLTVMTGETSVKPVALVVAV
jgi:hypothetical protein